MIKGWRNNPEWVRLHQEREAERARLRQVRWQVELAKQVAEHERKMRELDVEARGKVAVMRRLLETK